MAGKIDVTVMGAGIFGLSIAWSCLSRGARVRVIDPGGPGAGASGGVLGALAPHTPDAWNVKKAFQLDSLLAAGDFWSSVADASGIDPGYARTGRFQPISDERALASARNREAAAAANWAGRSIWQVMRAPQDWGPASPTGLVVHDTLSARIHPRRACDSLASAIASRGGEILREGRPEGAIVWATGVAGLADLGQALGQRVGGAQKGQAAILDHAAPRAPQIFAEGVHIVPHSDGTTAIGSTSERDVSEPLGTDGQLDALIARARDLVPALAGAPVRERWAGQRPRANSRAPMLGAWPGRAGHYVANGGFKIGFGMACGVASAMAALVLDGDDRIPKEFGVERSLRSPLRRNGSDAR